MRDDLTVTDLNRLLADGEASECDECGAVIPNAALGSGEPGWHEPGCAYRED